MIILTGGAGFIGSVILSKLNQEGVDDVVVVDSFHTSTKWKNLIGKKFRECLHKDELLPKLERKELSKVDAIIHMGACSSTAQSDMDYLLRNNYQYTIRLAEFALNRGARFIYASSAATYGDGNDGFVDDVSKLHSLKPLNPYGFSKHLADLWLNGQGMLSKVCGLKFFNVYGPNEYHKGDMSSVVVKAYHQAMTDGAIRLFKSYRADYKDGEQKRDFIYVRDCADVVWWLLKNKNVNGLFNLGSGNADTWLELAKSVFLALGKEPNIEFIDMPLALRKQYQYYTKADMAKFKAAGCDIQFRSLREGVLEYVLGYLGKGAHL